MILTDFSLIPYDLPLRQPWRSARGGIVSRQGWLVRLQTDAGLVGYGDCAPLPEAGTEGLLAALPALQRHGGLLCGLTPQQALAELAMPESPAARCGLETALLDVLARQAGQPLARWLNPAAAMTVQANAALGSLDDRVVGRALAAVAEGYTVLKLKVGVAAWPEELARLRELAGSLLPGVSLRLDANRAWDEAAARGCLGALADLPVESVEDPLAAPDLASWRRLQAGLPFPLAADESLSMLGGKGLFGRSAVRRLVLKPMVLGGLQPALALARRAGEVGVECVATTTLDSAVGVHAALHLAAALANGLAHGLATSSWLARDVGAPPQSTGARFQLGSDPGLACRPETNGKNIL